MKRYTLIFLIYLQTLAISPSLAADNTIDTMRQSLQLGAARKFEQAHRLLDKTIKQEPNNYDLQLAKARLLNWEQEQTKALKIINALPEKIKNSADALFLKGSIAYAQSNPTKAEDLLIRAQNLSPQDTDISTALVRVRRALKVPKAKKWQLDLGHETSEFTRRDRPNWQETSLRLTYFGDDKDWSLFSAVHGYTRFRNTDAMFYTGGHYKFSKRTSAYAWTAITPEPYFRPKWSLAIGTQSLISDLYVPIYASLDTKFELYTRTNSTTIKPGFRIEPVDGWAAGIKFVTVQTKDSHPLYGWETRLDGTAFDTVRFFTGLSNAPEYDDGSTVDTRSFFSGLGFDVNNDLSLRLSYTRDKREQSYIRHVYYVGSSYRF